jgi:hypothetical protein
MLTDERELILEEEWLIVRDSGEIPEVALHSSLDYLCNDPEGPGFLLSNEELTGLYCAVQERYLEIILRDLSPSNRTLPLYRGVKRAIINWKRLINFCRRVQLEHTSFVKPVSDAFLELVAVECSEQKNGKPRASGFNCTVDDVAGFLDSIDIVSSELPVGWIHLCRD